MLPSSVVTFSHGASFPTGPAEYSHNSNDLIESEESDGGDVYRSDAGEAQTLGSPTVEGEIERRAGFRVLKSQGTTRTASQTANGAVSLLPKIPALAALDRQLPSVNDPHPPPSSRTGRLPDRRITLPTPLNHGFSSEDLPNLQKYRTRVVSVPPGRPFRPYHSTGSLISVLNHNEGADTTRPRRGTRYGELPRPDPTSTTSRCWGVIGSGSIRRIPGNPPKRLIREIVDLTRIDVGVAKLLYTRFRRLAPSGFMRNSRFKASTGMLALLDDSFLCCRLFQGFDWLDDDVLDFLEWGVNVAIMISGTQDERLALAYRILNPTGRARGIEAHGGPLWRQGGFSFDHDDRPTQEDFGDYLQQRWQILYASHPEDRSHLFRCKGFSDSVYESLPLHEIGAASREDDSSHAQQRVEFFPKGDRQQRPSQGAGDDTVLLTESILVQPSHALPGGIRGITASPSGDSGGLDGPQYTVKLNNQTTTAQAEEDERSQRNIVPPLQNLAHLSAPAASQTKTQFGTISRRRSVVDLLDVTAANSDPNLMLTLPEFIHIVHSLEQTKDQLMGDTRNASAVPAEIIASVFRSAATFVDENQTRRLTYDDFRIAVDCNADFMSLMGVQPLAAHLFQGPLDPPPLSADRCRHPSPTRTPGDLRLLPEGAASRYMTIRSTRQHEALGRLGSEEARDVVPPLEFWASSAPVRQHRMSGARRVSPTADPSTYHFEALTLSQLMVLRQSLATLKQTLDRGKTIGPAFLAGFPGDARESELAGQRGAFGSGKSEPISTRSPRQLQGRLQAGQRGSREGLRATSMINGGGASEDVYIPRATNTDDNQSIATEIRSPAPRDITHGGIASNRTREGSSTRQQVADEHVTPIRRTARDPSRQPADSYSGDPGVPVKRKSPEYMFETSSSSSSMLSPKKAKAGAFSRRHLHLFAQPEAFHQHSIPDCEESKISDIDPHVANGGSACQGSSLSISNDLDRQRPEQSSGCHSITSQSVRLPIRRLWHQTRSLERNLALEAGDEGAIVLLTREQVDPIFLTVTTDIDESPVVDCITSPFSETCSSTSFPPREGVQDRLLTSLFSCEGGIALSNSESSTGDGREEHSSSTPSESSSNEEEEESRNQQFGTCHGGVVSSHYQHRPRDANDDYHEQTRFGIEANTDSQTSLMRRFHWKRSATKKLFLPAQLEQEVTRLPSLAVVAISEERRSVYPPSSSGEELRSVADNHSGIMHRPFGGVTRTIQQTRRRSPSTGTLLSSVTGVGESNRQLMAPNLHSAPSSHVRSRNTHLANFQRGSQSQASSHQLPGAANPCSEDSLTFPLYHAQLPKPTTGVATSGRLSIDPVQYPVTEEVCGGRKASTTTTTTTTAAECPHFKGGLGLPLSSTTEQQRLCGSIQVKALSQPPTNVQPGTHLATPSCETWVFKYCMNPPFCGTGGGSAGSATPTTMIDQLNGSRKSGLHAGDKVGPPLDTVLVRGDSQRLRASPHNMSSTGNLPTPRGGQNSANLHAPYPIAKNAGGYSTSKNLEFGSVCPRVGLRQEGATIDGRRMSASPLIPHTSPFSSGVETPGGTPSRWQGTARHHPPFPRLPQAGPINRCVPHLGASSQLHRGSSSSASSIDHHQRHVGSSQPPGHQSGLPDPKIRAYSSRLQPGVQNSDRHRRHSQQQSSFTVFHADPLEFTASIGISDQIPQSSRGTGGDITNHLGCYRLRRGEPNNGQKDRSRYELDDRSPRSTCANPPTSPLSGMREFDISGVIADPDTPKPLRSSVSAQLSSQSVTTTEQLQITSRSGQSTSGRMSRICEDGRGGGSTHRKFEPSRGGRDGGTSKRQRNSNTEMAATLIERLLLWLDDVIAAWSVQPDPNRPLLALPSSGKLPQPDLNYESYPSAFHDEASSLPQRMYANPTNFRVLREQAETIHRASRRRRVESKFLDSGPRGLVVHFGHESWNMVLNMMVGLRIAAARASFEPMRSVEPYDFLMREKFSILPRASNVIDKLTRYNYTAVRFIDYAPMVFRKLREIAGLNGAEYIRSVGPEQLVGNMMLGSLSSMSELCSEGKSGALFYYTADGRFLVKTMTKEAAGFFRSMLRSYFEHVVKNPSTLLTRFHGFHAIRLQVSSRRNASRKLYFVVMGNVFRTKVILHRRYDLKGSWIGRSAVPVGSSLEDLDPTTALKDLDFLNMRERIRLGPLRNAFMESLKKDADFLRDQEVIDYSLLFGIHVRRLREGSCVPPNLSVAAMDEVDMSSYRAIDSSVSDEGFSQQATPQLTSRWPWLDPDGMPSTDGRALYFCGVIDILTKWTTRKKMEHVVKSTTAPSDGISCVNPQMYADRFARMIESAID